MADAELTKLYGIFDEIGKNKAAGKSSENAALFNSIMEAAKGETDCKRLAAQFICRLFKDFPAEQKAAYNVLIDLIEDEDALTRKQVISGLPKLCKDVEAYVSKVADLLVQMLQTDDPQELTVVQLALQQVMGANCADAIKGIMGQINHEDLADLARERAVKFLADKLPSVSQEQLTPKIEEQLASELNEALKSADRANFINYIRILSALQCMRTLTGRQKLVNLIFKQIDFNAAFAPTDASRIAQLQQCADQVAPFLSKNINAKDFVVYFLDKIIPVIHSIPTAKADDATDSPQLALLKCFAELSSHTGNGFAPTDKQLESLVQRVINELPAPKTDADGSVPADALKQTELNYGNIECLLFGLHQIGRHNGAVYFEQKPELIADLRKRLLFLHQANQAKLKSIKAELDGLTKEQLKLPAGKRRVMLARSSENISSLVRELSKQPPSFKAELSLSWKPLPEAPKRPASIGDATAATDADSKRRAINNNSNNNSSSYNKQQLRSPVSPAAAAARGGGGRSRYTNFNNQQQQQQRGGGGGGRGRSWSGNRW